MHQSSHPPQPNCSFRIRPPDPIDQITGKLGQLYILLSSLHGDGLDNFLGLSQELQDNLLWLAAELTKEIHDTIALLPYPIPASKA